MTEQEKQKAKRDKAQVDLVINWQISRQPKLQDEPQAYKAALIRMGAEGMLQYCHDTSVNTRAIDTVMDRFQRCIAGMVSPEYEGGYREALLHLRSELSGVDSE